MIDRPQPWRLPTGPRAGGAQLDELIALASTDTPGAGALRRFLAHGDAPDRAARLQARNDALRAALAALAPAATWAACGALAMAVQRFEARVLPRLLAGGDVGDLGPLDTALLQARLAAPLPRTQRMLFAVMHRQKTGRIL